MRRHAPRPKSAAPRFQHLSLRGSETALEEEKKEGKGQHGAPVGRLQKAFRIEHILFFVH